MDCGVGSMLIALLYKRGREVRAYKLLGTIVRERNGIGFSCERG